MKLILSLLIAGRLLSVLQGQGVAVTTQPEAVTQYRGNVLLAHSYLAGQYFREVAVGDSLSVATADGATVYTVTDIRRFQALQPHSTRSEFVDLDTDRHYTAAEVAEMMYSHELALQTCIDLPGKPAWGRLFIIAEAK